MTEQTKSTELATLPPAERAAIALSSSKIEVQLRELVQETADIQSVIDPAGREQAHRAGMKLKNTRVAIEKTGKTARDDAQAFSKAVISEEKRLIGMIEPEERRVLSIRDAYDAKVAAEKAEKERIERERVNAIRTKIDAIRQIPATMAGEPSSEIRIEIDALKAFAPDDSFGEFAIDARNAAVVALDALEALYHRVRVQEEDAARLAAERAELERQRQEREAEEARLKAEREKFEDERRVFMMEQAQARRQEERRAVGSSGTYFDLNDIKENGDPVMRNADGSRSIFCDVDEDDNTDNSKINRAHTAAEQVATDIAVLASVSSDPDAMVDACLATRPEPIFLKLLRSALHDALNEHAPEQVRAVVEEEFAKVGLS